MRLGNQGKDKEAHSEEALGSGQGPLPVGTVESRRYKLHL